MTQIRRRQHKPQQTSSRKSAVNKSAADSSRQNKVKMILLRRGHIFYSAWEEQRAREEGGESVRQIYRAGRTDEGRVDKRWELTKPCKTLQNGKIDKHKKTHAQVKCVCVCVCERCVYVFHALEISSTLDFRCKLCYNDNKLWFWSVGERQLLCPKSHTSIRILKCSTLIVCCTYFDTASFGTFYSYCKWRQCFNHHFAFFYYNLFYKQIQLQKIWDNCKR